MRFFFLFFFLFLNLAADQHSLKKNGFVTVELQGQFGNQLFQIATAYTYALDHNCFFSVPNLFTTKKWNIATNAQRLFTNRISDESKPKKSKTWTEPSLRHGSIPIHSKIHLVGYFQSEKYFQHRRSEILKLFAPPANLMQKIEAKYPSLSTTSKIVGVQIRDYRSEFPKGDYHPTHGRSYYEKAISHFPTDTTFVVSTNNPKYAQECMDGLAATIIYLNSGDYIEDFYVLTQCHSFIISNSSFGWWAAWLSECSDKLVIAPRPWLAPPYDDKQTCELLPTEWIAIEN